MVGKAFRVIFTRYAQRRRREIFDFEEKLNGKRYAKKVQQAINKESGKLEKMPDSIALEWAFCNGQCLPARFWSCQLLPARPSLSNSQFPPAP